MAESVESPGRRRLSPPAVGARPGRRGRPGLPARAGARRAGIGPSGSGGRAKAAAFIRRHRLGPAGRSLVLVVRDAHRSESTQDLVTSVLADRPDAVLVEMGLPVWQPPARRYRAYVATYGASRANGQAAAEVLGLTSR